VFDGYAAAAIQGIPPGHQPPGMTLPCQRAGLSGCVVAQAVSQLRLAGVNGPYTLVLGTAPYTAIGGASTTAIRWLTTHPAAGGQQDHLAAGIEGASCLTTGGDFQSHRQDIDRLSQPFRRGSGCIFRRP